MHRLALALRPIASSSTCQCYSTVARRAAGAGAGGRTVKIGMIRGCERRGRSRLYSSGDHIDVGPDDAAETSTQQDGTDAEDSFSKYDMNDRTSSPFYRLFSAPDAFKDPQSGHIPPPQELDSPKPRRTRLSERIPAEDELNQEWSMDLGRPQHEYDNENVVNLRGTKPYQTAEGRAYGGAMTSQEAETFENIFKEVWGPEKKREVQEKPVPPSMSAFAGHGLFGHSVDGSAEDRLRNFYNQTTGQRKRMREGQSKGGMARHDNRKARGTKVQALVHELMGSRGGDQVKVVELMDRAITQLQACQTQNEIWEWAQQNVWPAEISAHSTVDQQQSPPFGVYSLVYSPVLLAMFKELRDRFRAPHAALALVRMVRNLGPESLVLGGSPYLYAEAIRTSWNVLGDLQSARDLVREARDIGSVSGASDGSSTDLMQRHASTAAREAQDDDWDTIQAEKLIGRVVEDIHDDVQHTVFRTQQAIGLDKTSHLLLQKLALAKEMMQMIRQPSAERELDGKPSRSVPAWQARQPHDSILEHNRRPSYNVRETQPLTRRPARPLRPQESYSGDAHDEKWRTDIADRF